MQAAIRPPPGFTSAQFFLTSSPHTFLSSAALASTALHGAERSFTCDSTQALMRPSPGCTPAHCVLISAAHCLATALCAIELVAESDKMTTVPRRFFNISVSPLSSLIGCRTVSVIFDKTVSAHGPELHPVRCNEMSGSGGRVGLESHGLIRSLLGLIAT
jgi:hypothetical protein